MRHKENKAYYKKIARQIADEEARNMKSLEVRDYKFTKEFENNLEEALTHKHRRNSRRAVYRLALSFAVAFVLMIVCSFAVKQNNIANIVVAAEIEYNMAKLTELSTSQITSSNPYDFKNELYYENIVNMGISAVSILEKKHQKGISSYIAACAIEEIMQINISAVMKEDWETGDAFFVLWDDFVADIPKIFETISKETADEDEFRSVMKSYGVIGEYYIYYCSGENEKTDFYGGRIFYEPKNQEVDLEEAEIKALRTYLDQKLGETGSR